MSEVAPDGIGGTDGDYTQHLRGVFKLARFVANGMLKHCGPHNFRPPADQIEAAWLDAVAGENMQRIGACILEMNGQRMAVIPHPDDLKARRK